jgi:signal peptidase II
MLILLIGMVLTAVDQVLKCLVRQHIRPGETIPVIDGFFNLSHVCNTGAAWGLLAGFQPWLIGLSIVMLIALVAFRRHFLTDTLCHRVATGLMCAGIIGNLIDRLRLGHVVDFVDLHWRGAHFPSFNVADSAICIGVGLYMLTQVFPSLLPGGAASTASPAAPPAPPAGTETRA